MRFNNCGKDENGFTMYNLPLRDCTYIITFNLSSLRWCVFKNFEDKYLFASTDLDACKSYVRGIVRG